MSNPLLMALAAATLAGSVLAAPATSGPAAAPAASTAPAADSRTASEPASAPVATFMPAPTQYPQSIHVLVAVGLLVLMVVVLMYLANPSKLRLDRTPGRRNRLTPYHILALLLGWFLAMAGVQKLATTHHVEVFANAEGKQETKDLDTHSPEVLLAGGAGIQVLMLTASLIVARRTFRLGIRRGMGLDASHWKFWTVQAVIAYLAVFPICFGADQLLRYLLRDTGMVHEHPMLVALQTTTLPWKIVNFASSALLVPVMEEVFFRGLFQSMLREFTGRCWVSILATSVLFAVLHPVQDIGAIFIFSIVLGYLYERSGRLYASILTHILFNLVFMFITVAS